jgi:Domain of unknown function (DUF4279)
MHEYTVELRISGTQLVPATITQALNLEPSLTHEVGERKTDEKTWDQGLWSYDGSPSNTQTSWSSLEDGLHFLLDKLEHFHRQIDEYKQQYCVVIWCGHFQSSFDGGPKLSAKIMGRLSDFGVDLYIDNYFADFR